MSVSIDAHPRIQGATPTARIIDWGGRITLKVQIGSHSMCWYLEPAAGESVDEYITRVVAGLGNVSVELPVTASVAN